MVLPQYFGHALSHLILLVIFRSSSLSPMSATVKFARVHPKDEDTSKLATLDATIYTTDLFHLPAGGVGLAIGRRPAAGATEPESPI